MFSLFIDISRWQWSKPIPWKLLRERGVVGCICKSTHGLGTDPNFVEGFKQAREEGFLRGAYEWYVPSRDPLAQAKYAAEVLLANGFDADDALCIDFEEPTSTKGQALLDPFVTHMEAFEAALDKPAILYTGTWFWVEYVLNLDSEACSKRDLWLSQYPSFGLKGFDPEAYAKATELAANYKTTIPKPWASRGKRDTLFQFDGDKGLTMPNGVDADFNVFRGDRDALAALFATTLSQPARTLPAPAPTPTLLGEKPQESVVLNDFLGSLVDPDAALAEAGRSLSDDEALVRALSA
jgi:GH25 family lysozyme M1 (1,4-beta-N-acetylmuramidase)